ncbi:MAG: hypothetical protein IPJ56_11785 [Gemmatimonadetes bacterium]|nr:hypothetical protein [Gemmatimonadota bacterium]
MNGRLRVASLALAILFGLAQAALAQAACGVERWPVKIAADDDFALVDTVQVPTTVAELTQIRRPETAFAFRRRVAPIELRTFVLRARLVRVSAQEDSDLHLVLRDLLDDTLTIVAEIPSPDCTADPYMARRFENARAMLRGTQRNGVIEIVGIGFFDFPHGQSGMARNGLEIHPVLSLRPIRP